MRTLFRSIWEGFKHDVVRFVWCVRVALLIAITACLIAGGLASARHFYLWLTSQPANCEEKPIQLTEEEKAVLRCRLLGKDCPGVAPDSSAKQQKAETQDESPTTAPSP